MFFFSLGGIFIFLIENSRDVVSSVSEAVPVGIQCENNYSVSQTHTSIS